jgi:hypothetical protein
MKEFLGNMKENISISKDDIKDWFKKPQPE